MSYAVNIAIGVLSGVLSGLGATGLLAGLFSRYLERSIDSRFNLLEQSHEIVGKEQIEHRRVQLAELYGPLYADLKSSETIYDLWRARKLDGINEEIKVRFRDQNKAMIELIGSKAHLIDEPTFPPEMMHFVTSIAIWNMYTSRQDGLPSEVAAQPESQFPVKFRDYVFRKTEELKRTLEELYRKYAIK